MKSIKTKLKDPATKAVIRIIGSIFTILSGVMLFSDKIFYFSLDNTFGFSDTQTFIWVLSQSLSPVLLILGSVLRCYRISYTVPLYFYFIQLYWVFDASLKIDDVLLHIYAIGVVLFFCISALIISKIFTKALNERATKLNLLESMLDLSITISEKKK